MDLSTVNIAFPVWSPQMVAYYNSIRRSGDLALVPTSSIGLLPTIGGGAVPYFDSWATGASRLDGIAADSFAVGYDPEHRTETPTTEQNSLLATVQAASAAVHAKSLPFLLVPDDAFDTQFTAGGHNQLAPFVDIYVIQGEHQEAHGATAYATWIDNNITAIKAANNACQVWPQVSADNATVATGIACLNAVVGTVDGIVIWCGPSGFGALQSFLARRGGRPKGAT